MSIVLGLAVVACLFGERALLASDVLLSSTRAKPRILPRETEKLPVYGEGKTTTDNTP